MLRSAASKVMWAGKATVFLVGLAVIVVLTVGVVSQASAQNNRPAQNVFMLGATNTANAMSSLVGSVANSAMLLVENNGGGPALDLQVEPGQAPMKVNSGAKVDNLNADAVDGKSREDFYAAGTKVADADKLDNLDSTNFQRANAAAGGHLTGTYPNPTIANGAVGSTQINSTQVQQRVSGTCSPGSSIRTIAQDGTVTCESPSLSGYEIVQASSDFNTAAHKVAQATCPTGKKVMGGGGSYSTDAVGVATSSFYEVAIMGSRPFGNGYNVQADWMGGSGASPLSWRVVAYAICVTG